MIPWFHLWQMLTNVHSKPAPVAIDDGTHQCAKWEAIEKWTEDRWFDAFQPGLLIHPLYGM